MKTVTGLLATWMALMVLHNGNAGLQADVVWDEGMNGDLSTLPGSPTVLDFNFGANTVIASVTESTGDLRDFITFTIGPNQLLTGIILDSFSPAGVSFHGINSGATGLTPGVDPNGSFLGLEFVTDFEVGSDVMPALAAGAFGSTGFMTPLGAGTYTYVFQEVTGGQARSYQLSFNVVPEPSTAAFLVLAGLTAASRFRRRLG